MSAGPLEDTMLVHSFEELVLSGNLPSPAGVGLRVLQLTRDEDLLDTFDREIVPPHASSRGELGQHLRAHAPKEISRGTGEQDD